jgi:hypothetical protein
LHINVVTDFVRVTQLAVSVAIHGTTATTATNATTTDSSAANVA